MPAVLGHLRVGLHLVTEQLLHAELQAVLVEVLVHEEVGQHRVGEADAAHRLPLVLAAVKRTTWLPVAALEATAEAEERGIELRVVRDRDDAWALLEQRPKALHDVALIQRWAQVAHDRLLATRLPGVVILGRERSLVAEAGRLLLDALVRLDEHFHRAAEERIPGAQLASEAGARVAHDVAKPGHGIARRHVDGDALDAVGVRMETRGLEVEDEGASAARGVDQRLGLYRAEINVLECGDQLRLTSRSSRLATRPGWRTPSARPRA